MLTILVNLLLLVVVALVVFYIAKYILAEAEADPPIRKIVLLILLVLFLIALINVCAGFRMWGPLVVV